MLDPRTLCHAGGSSSSPAARRRRAAARVRPGRSGRGGAAAARGTWLAGDFHCHTTYSHDVWGGPDRVPQPDDPFGELADSYTWGWSAAEQIAIAESRDLDFLAITDHNRVDALTDPGYAQRPLTLVPGYEHSLRGGHVGVFTPTVDALPDLVRDADGSTGFDGDEALGASSTRWPTATAWRS
jgi:hypothetical protein